MKKYFFILLVFLVLSGIFFYFLLFKGKTEKDTSGIDWDNPEEVFNIQIPAGFNEYQIQRTEEKKTEARELYNTKKDDTWTWIVIGNLYKYIEDYDRAIGAYKQALAIQPLEVISIQNLATIYEKYKPDYEKAKYYYEQLLNANASIPKYHADFAKFCDTKLKNRKMAEEVLLNGLEKTSYNPDLLVSTIRFYEKYEEIEKAAQYAKILIDLDPENELYHQDFYYLLQN